MIPGAADVIRKAVRQAADQLGLDRRALVGLLGLDGVEVGDPLLAVAPGTPAWDRALDVVEIYSLLMGLTQEDEDAARTWLHAYNPQIETTPRSALVAEGGLRTVRNLLASAYR